MRFIIGVGLVTALVSRVSAAEIPVVPAPAAPPPVQPYNVLPAYVPGYNWTGFYVGANAGAAWTTGSGTVTILTPAGLALSVPSDASKNATGVIGGGQIGYNWQIANWVLGVEADADASGQESASTAVPCGLTVVCDVQGSTSVKSFGTVRGRAGFTVGDNRWLIYGTAGFAWQQVSTSIDVIHPSGRVSNVVSGSTTTTGYAVGAGFEVALWGNWTGGAEYLFIHTGDFTNAGGAVVVPGVLNIASITQSNSLNNNVFRARVNYRF